MEYLLKEKKIVKGLILFFTAFVGIGAVAGSLGMISDPSGKAMGMDLVLPYFQKMPFADLLFQNLLFPGISLLIVNGISNIIAFILILKEKKAGYILGFVFGITLMMWISIQFWLFAPDIPVLDVIFMTIGFVQFIVGYRAFVNYMQRDFCSRNSDLKTSHITGKKTAVVYFSRMGYTRRLAAEYAEQHDTDLIELSTTEMTEGISGFWWCGRFGMHRWKMKLRPIDAEISSYEKIYIFSPAWVFHISSPVRSFIIDYSDKIKSSELFVIHFNPGKCTFLFSEAEKILESKLVLNHSVHCAFGKTKYYQ